MWEIPGFQVQTLTQCNMQFFSSGRKWASWSPPPPIVWGGRPANCPSSLLPCLYFQPSPSPSIFIAHSILSRDAVLRSGGGRGHGRWSLATVCWCQIPNVTDIIPNQIYCSLSILSRDGVLPLQCSTPSLLRIEWAMQGAWQMEPLTATVCWCQIQSTVLRPAQGYADFVKHQPNTGRVRQICYQQEESPLDRQP